MNQESTPLVSTRSVGIRYGLFLAIVSVLFFLITSVAGVNTQQGPMQYIGIVFVLVFVVLAHHNFKQSGDGYMRYGQGFSIGMWVTLISSAISSVFMYVYIKFVDAAFIDFAREKAIADMEEKGINEDVIEQSMVYVEKFLTPEMIFVFGLLGGLFFGLVVSLIVSIFTQKTNQHAQI